MPFVFQKPPVAPPPPPETPLAYSHYQGVPADVWVITHNLGFIPNVTVFDADGVETEGQVDHYNGAMLQVAFNTPVAGIAYMS